MAHIQYNVPGQTNLATVNTFFLGKPAPIVAERIWDTKEHAQSYINDTVGSALAGIILRVTDDTTNNGAYLVEKDASATNGLKLSKLKDDYPFATSTTSATTAAKIVTVDTGYFELKIGQRITVYFTNRNTANSPTLNIDSTGAKNIYAFNGSSWSQITSGNNKNWLYNYVDFIYNGTYYKLVDNYYNVDQIGYSSNLDEEHSILIKKTNNTNNERGSVYFSNGSNTLATINTNTGKITTPGYILSNNGSAVITKRVLVGDGTSVDAPTTTDTYLKATITENEGITTTVLSWAPVSGGSGGTVTSVKAGDGLSATNSEGTSLTNDEITGSGIINLNYTTSSTIGGIKLGFTDDTANRKYGLQLGKNSDELNDERAYVEVPLMGASGNNHKPGLVPDTPTTIGNNKFLRENAAWEQVSMENIYEVTSNPSSVGFLRRTSNGEATPTYSWDMITPTSASSAMNSLLIYNNSNGALFYNNAITSNGAGCLYLNDAATTGDSYQLELTPNSSNPFNLKKKASGTSLYSSVANKVVLSNGLISAPTGDSGDEKYLKATIGANDSVTFSWGTVSGDTDTWRNIYINSGSTETIGTGTNTKAINYTSGNGITISYEEAGTSTGQSGSSDYFNIKTTLNVAGNNTLGGIKLGYTNTGRNMAVETDGEKAYVNTHTTNMNTVYIAGTNITLSTPTTTDYTLTSTDVYNDADSSMFKVQLTPTVTSFNDDTIIKVRFPSNVISNKRLVFYTGTDASVGSNLISCYNNDIYTTGSKWFYPSSNILHSDMYYYFIRKSSPNGFIYLGTNVESISASGGGGGSTYKFTLNGTTYGDSTNGTNLSGANNDGIFAPSSAGTANQILISGGANTAPDWGTLGIEGFNSGSGVKSRVRLNIGSYNTSWATIKMAATDTIPSGASTTSVSGETLIDEILFYPGTNISFEKVTVSGASRQGLKINATGGSESDPIYNVTLSYHDSYGLTHPTIVRYGNDYENSNDEINYVDGMVMTVSQYSWNILSCLCNLGGLPPVIVTSPDNAETITFAPVVYKGMIGPAYVFCDLWSAVLLNEAHAVACGYPPTTVYGPHRQLRMYNSLDEYGYTESTGIVDLGNTPLTFTYMTKDAFSTKSAINNCYGPLIYEGNDTWTDGFDFLSNLYKSDTILGMPLWWAQFQNYGKIINSIASGGVGIRIKELFRLDEFANNWSDYIATLRGSFDENTCQITNLDDLIGVEGLFVNPQVTGVFIATSIPSTTINAFFD